METLVGGSSAPIHGTDHVHKNLEYLRDAKRLNPRQARLALFFTRFNFSISYRPGSRNLKADALSRLHAPEEDCKDPKYILPEDLFQCPIQWSSESISPSSVSTNDPPGCPPGLQYVTRTKRTPLIHSAHASLGTGHPGAETLLNQVFRYFGIPEDIVSDRGP